MPPKGWRKYPDGFKLVNSAGTPVKEKEEYTLDDLLLPKATIYRLATGSLPEGTQVPADGLLALRRSTAVFINYLSAEANKVAQATARKTIQPADVYKALENVDLAQLVPEVKAQLEAYLEGQRQKKERKAAEKKSDAAVAEDPEEEEIVTSDEEADSGDSTEKKRLKTDDGDGEGNDDSEAPLDDDGDIEIKDTPQADKEQ
ncbi:DNA polymerase epsilon subunit D [Trichomonascus vanleenenianus]|uniref:DNA polymerase epsilon noncatalytic subunit n=1 Tax=Trichomonascus vanleenenianus TaxID=2268995 RepID=UPI003ECAABC6